MSVQADTVEDLVQKLKQHRRAVEVLDLTLRFVEPRPTDVANALEKILNDMPVPAVSVEKSVRTQSKKSEVRIASNALLRQIYLLIKRNPRVYDDLLVKKDAEASKYFTVDALRRFTLGVLLVYWTHLAEDSSVEHAAKEIRDFCVCNKQHRGVIRWREDRATLVSALRHNDITDSITALFGEPMTAIYELGGADAIGRHKFTEAFNRSVEMLNRRYGYCSVVKTVNRLLCNIASAGDLYVASGRALPRYMCDWHRASHARDFLAFCSLYQYPNPLPSVSYDDASNRVAQIELEISRLKITKRILAGKTWH